MMNEMPPRLQRVMHLQRGARFLGAVIIPVTVGLLLSMLWPVAGFFWWVTFAGLCMIATQFWTTISYIIIGAILMNDLSRQEILIPEVPKEKYIDMVIKETGPAIGKFKEQDILEWIDFEAFGQVIRAHYLGTVEGEYAVKLPEDSIVMPPGIVYQFRQVEPQ